MDCTNNPRPAAYADRRRIVTVGDAAASGLGRARTVTTGLLLAVLALLIVAVWVIAKVRYYARRSERQWQKVDKSKLRRWDDEDDWHSG